MRLSKSLALASLILSAASLSGGAALGGSWKLALAAGLPLLVGLYNLRARSSGLCTLGLGVSVCLAGVGVLKGGEPGLVLLGAALALAAWDLALFDLGLRQDEPDSVIREGEPGRDKPDSGILEGEPGRLERKHYQALGLAVGAGLAAAWIGSTVRLTLPFGVMLGLVVLAIWSLDRAVRGLKER